MIRALHRWPGLLALLLLTVLALSGAALSVFPAAERFSAPQAAAELTVAELGARIQAAYPGVEQIRRAPSGRITAYWFDNDVRACGRDRPGDRQGRCLGRPQWRAALAHHAAPLAVPGRRRAHRDGGGCGGDARPGAVGHRHGGAARGRLAALVRPPQGAARGPAACGDRAHRRARPRCSPPSPRCG